MLSNSLSRTKRSRISSAIGLGVLGVVLAASLWLVLNRQYVVDQLTVWQYAPPAEVTAIAGRAKLASKGEFYLYASRAQVDSAEKFNQYCQKVEEHSAILGCYAGGQIYIYDVDNQQLDGIKEVTAVHEMLHAAWDRLSRHEQSELSALLETEYTKHADKELEERMGYYARAQPGERANELHSIVGSEMRNISPELEQHYKQYLSDRSVVVSLHERYASVFTAVKAESDALEAQLSTLADSIDAATAQYNSAVATLNSDVVSFNSRAQGGGFTSQSQFASERSALVSRSAALDSDRQKITADIATYQQLLGKLREVNSRSEALNRSIDSTLTPSQSI